MKLWVWIYKKIFFWKEKVVHKNEIKSLLCSTRAKIEGGGNDRQKCYGCI